ncbi:hypothetical protein LMG28614_06986 [Paraburkholderia ultramafica]|uniref:Uncharacterized protein n=1 Tax=Paraburkholderia ultramafica TaxID=1544867 RepID=A0A6S7D758_9BURK|nr:hypothetical protein [Paraburkholderia ultramafica]CAB3809236.1 hypothetical protein LMG28614_06986 [Paraburkholderia ultramafica]
MPEIRIRESGNKPVIQPPMATISVDAERVDQRLIGVAALDGDTAHKSHAGASNSASKLTFPLRRFLSTASGTARHLA